MVNIAPGQTEVSFPVEAINDVLWEDDTKEQLTFTIVDSSPGLNPNPMSLVLTITDPEDSKSVGFTTTAHSLTEEAGTYTTTLSIPAPATFDITANVYLNHGAAPEGITYANYGTDFSTGLPTQEASGSRWMEVTIPAGETSTTFDISLKDDEVAENEETIRLDIAYMVPTIEVGILVSNATLTLTVEDQDINPYASFKTLAANYTENLDRYIMQLVLDKAATTDQTVTLQIAEGEGITTEDYYIALDGDTDGNGDGVHKLTPDSEGKFTLDLPAGATSLAFYVYLGHDGLSEADEVLTFKMVGASAGLDYDPAASSSLTILDIDVNVASLTPADDATGVSVTTPLNINFVNNIMKGRGSIRIRDYDTDAILQTIDVESADVTVNGSEASFNATLQQNKHYYIEVDALAFKEGRFGNSTFAGISGKDTWSFSTSTLTSIADEIHSGFLVYPNPVKNHITFVLPEQVASQPNIKLNVLSAQGKSIANASGNKETLQQIINSKLTSLPSGLYLLKLEAGDKVYQTRLIKK